jgi:hypothetical protein
MRAYVGSDINTYSERTPCSAYSLPPVNNYLLSLKVSRASSAKKTLASISSQL